MHETNTLTVGNEVQLSVSLAAGNITFEVTGHNPWHISVAEEMREKLLENLEVAMGIRKRSESYHRLHFPGDAQIDWCAFIGDPEIPGTFVVQIFIGGPTGQMPRIYERSGYEFQLTEMEANILRKILSN